MPNTGGPGIKIIPSDLEDPGLVRLNARLDLNTSIAAAASTTATKALSASAVINATLSLSYSGSAGTVGEPYNGGLVAAGGQAPYIYTISGLPAGLSLNPTTGAVSGVPTMAGTYAVSGSVNDSAGNSIGIATTIVITFNSQTRTVTTSGSQLSADFIVLFDTSGITGSTDTLNGTINSSVTTLTMTSGTGVVLGTQITIGTENMLITGGAAPTFDVQRNYGGTTAASHTSGATIDLPGALTFQLLAIAGLANRTFYLTKISTDINYAKLLADAAASDIFPGVPTPANIILADTSPALGSSQLVAPATGHIWYVAAGPGATGPQGSSGTATSLAPNITSATVVVGYQPNGYAPQLVTFSGVITLPTGAPNYSDLAKVVVTAVDPNGVAHDVVTLYSPYTGSTVDYNNANATWVVQPVINQTWSFLFTSYDVNGIAVTPAVAVTGIAVNAVGITSAPFSEIGPRVANNQQSVLSTFSVTPVIANGQLPIGVTWFVDPGTGVPILQQQALLTQAGQALTFSTFVPLSSANINWVSYVFVGYVTSNLSITPYNAGTTYSAGQTATYSDKLYSSISGGNTGHTPAPGGTAYWTDLGIPFAQSSATIPVVAYPSATGASLAFTNIAGAAPTATNIFMGLNGANQPYWQINLVLNTPGNADPSAFFYGWWYEWVDGSGNPISPGGTVSIPGWQPDDNIPNDGQSHFLPIIGGYPAPGVNAYYKVGIWALNRAATATVAPFTGDPNCVLQTNITHPGPFYIGQPPTGNSTNMLVNPNFNQGSASGTFTPSLMAWTVGAGGTITATTIVVSGETVSVAQIITGGAACSLSQSFTVRQGDTYTYEEWVAVTAGAGSGTVSLQISFANSAGGAVGSPATVNITSLLTSTIGVFSVTGTVPAGAVTMAVAIVTASGTSSTLIVTNGWLGAGAAAPLYMAGNQQRLATDQTMTVTGGALGMNPTLLSGQGANLIPNSYGGAGFAGWTSSGNFAVNTSVFYAPGTASFSIPSTAVASTLLLAGNLPAVPGQMFTAGAWIFADAGATVVFYLVVTFYSASFAYLGGGDVASGTATTSWAFISGESIVAPAGTTIVQFYVEAVPSGGGSGLGYITNLALYLMVTAPFMGNDAITVANATSVVQALALVDSIIATVGLNKLAATTVTQGTAIFTGDVILSRGSANPVMVLNTTGAYLYSSCSISGGVVTPSTTTPYLVAEPAGVLIATGPVGGASGMPYVQASASGVTVQGVTAISGSFPGYYYQTVIGPGGILMSFTNGSLTNASLNLSAQSITLASGLFSTMITASSIELIYNGTAYATLNSGGLAITAAITGGSLTIATGGSNGTVTISSVSTGIVITYSGVNTYIKAGEINIQSGSYTIDMNLTSGPLITLTGLGNTTSITSSSLSTTGFVQCTGNINGGSLSCRFGTCTAAGFAIFSGISFAGGSFTFLDQGGTSHQVMGGILLS